MSVSVAWSLVFLRIGASVRMKLTQARCLDVGCSWDLTEQMSLGERDGAQSTGPQSITGRQTTLTLTAKSLLTCLWSEGGSRSNLCYYLQLSWLRKFCDCRVWHFNLGVCLDWLLEPASSDHSQSFLFILQPHGSLVCHHSLVVEEFISAQLFSQISPRFDFQSTI